MINKRGQLTIWVILALILVASVILYFMLQRSPTTISSNDLNPQQFIDKCTQQSTEDALALMLPQGGFIHPLNTKTYDNVNISYLCQNLGNFKPCINQHPMFIQEMNREIETYIRPSIEQCFQDLKTELEKRNFAVSLDALNLTVNMGPDRVYVDIQKKMTTSKDGQTKTQESFPVEVISPIYDLANVAIEIASQQAKYCYFEYNGYMIIYPKFDIRVFTFSDSTKIYTIEDRRSGKKMNIAIRGCAIPPGV